MKSMVTIEGPFVIGGATLLAVVKSFLYRKNHQKASWLFGMKLPIAILIISDSTKRAFRANGEEISIEQLLEENPGINIDV